MMVKTIGIIITVLGTMFMINPNFVKEYLSFFLKERNLYLGGCLALLIGLALLFSAPGSKAIGFVVILGLVSIVKGVAILILGMEKLIPIIAKWKEKPISSLRIISGFTLAIGVLLIYSA